MKYYIYISDTKVDMLFVQIPQSILKKITGELNINLGMVSVSLKEKQSEQTRFDKVNVVSNYVKEQVPRAGDYFSVEILKILSSLQVKLPKQFLV